MLLAFVLCLRPWIPKFHDGVGSINLFEQTEAASGDDDEDAAPSCKKRVETAGCI